MVPDRMHLRVLKEVADVIVRLLLVAVERRWQSGKASDHWKKASATLIFNQGKKEDLGNYRLTDLVSII